MNKRVLQATVAAAGLFASSAALAITPTPTYLAKAGAGDLYETRSSELVLQTTKNTEVQAFAKRMISDHAKSTAMVKAAARKSGLVVSPPVLDPSQKDMVAKLTAAKGGGRDALYLEQQHAAHQQALALHEDYAATGDEPALKAAAAKIVPVVKSHIATMPH